MPELNDVYDEMLRCPTCNYCLRGTTNDPVTCPECGSEFSMRRLKHFAYGAYTPLERAIFDSMMWFGGFALLFVIGFVLLLAKTWAISLVAVAGVGGALSLRKFLRVTDGVEGRRLVLLRTVVSVFGFFALIVAVVWGGQRGVALLDAELGLPHALSIGIMTATGIVIVLWCTWAGLMAWDKHMGAFLCRCFPEPAEGCHDEAAGQEGATPE